MPFLIASTLNDVTQLVTAIGVVLGIVLSYLGRRNASQRADVLETKADAVVKLVNGPLTHSLKTGVALADANVKLADQVAAQSNLPIDHQVAADARSAAADMRAVFDTHQASISESRSASPTSGPLETLADKKNEGK